MSTRACIIKRELNGTYSAIYSHSDGYVKDGAGEELVRCWNDAADVNQLIADGDCNFPGDPYHDNSPARNYKSLKELLEKESEKGFDYYYLFTNIMGEWYWYCKKYPVTPKNGIEDWVLLNEEEIEYFD